MQYEWDEGKRIANLAKHEVDFKEAERFEWSTAIEALDSRFEYGEERWIALGFISKCLYVLIYTSRQAIIRIISLRRANKREREYYEKKQT